MKRQRRASTTRRQKQIYTQGQLNKTVDALLHPLVKVDPWFLVIDGVIHGLVERNPPETVAKFVQYNLPILVAELLRKRKSL